MYKNSPGGGPAANRKETAFPPGGAGGKRVEILDLWRSVCVWMMLLYHAAYDLTLFRVLPEAFVTHPAAKVYCYLGAGGFILLSGVCVRFSRDPIRRGVLVFCAGLGVTAVTTVAGYPVAFGVLSLLGCCMLLYGAARRWIEPRLGPVFAAVCLGLFALTWVLTAAIKVDIFFLHPLGMHGADFYSADYFPLFPWTFLFLTGTALGKALDARRGAPLLQRRFAPALTFCGRHSLFLYLVHQPVIYGIFWLIRGR